MDKNGANALLGLTVTETRFPTENCGFIRDLKVTLWIHIVFLANNDSYIGEYLEEKAIAFSNWDAT